MWPRWGQRTKYGDFRRWSSLKQSDFYYINSSERGAEAQRLWWNQQDGPYSKGVGLLIFEYFRSGQQLWFIIKNVAMHHTFKHHFITKSYPIKPSFNSRFRRTITAQCVDQQSQYQPDQTQPAYQLVAATRQPSSQISPICTKCHSAIVHNKRSESSPPPYAASPTTQAAFMTVRDPDLKLPQDHLFSDHKELVASTHGAPSLGRGPAAS